MVQGGLHVEYRPGSTRTVLHRVKGMPFQWSLNPYRGCRHACLYCYARIYHSYIGFDDPGDFDRVVLYKEDLPDRLRRELRRVGRRRTARSRSGRRQIPISRSRRGSA